MNQPTSASQQQELDHFNDLSAHWWDQDGAFAALHQINPLRLDFIERHTKLAERSVIDLGCGGGILTEAMARRGAAAIGVDLAENAITAARQHARNSGVTVEYQIAEITALSHEHAGAFDLVTCMEMLEHVDQPGHIIDAAARLVAPGGVVFFSTLNRNAKSWLLGIVAAEYLLNMVPKGTHQHKKFIRPGELSAMARQAGLKPIDRAGIVYHPFGKHFSLHPTDLDVNYLMAFRRDYE